MAGCSVQRWLRAQPNWLLVAKSDGYLVELLKIKVYDDNFPACDVMKKRGLIAIETSAYIRAKLRCYCLKSY